MHLTAVIPENFARWLRGKHFVFEVRDLWPYLPKEMCVIKNPLVLAAMSALEWCSYHSAHRFIGLSPWIVEGIKKRCVIASKVEIVTNGCDLTLFADEVTAWRPDGVADIDLMRFLAGSQIVSVQARRMGDTDPVEVTDDKAAIILGFADGSFGTIHYLANDAASFPKERVEVFVAGGTLQLDNFIKLKGFGWKGFKKLNLWKQDKGQTACSAAFINSIKQGTVAPISADELFEVAKVTIDVATQLRSQK